MKRKIDCKLNFGRHIPICSRLYVRFVDTETGEVLFNAHRDASFACSADGEKYIHQVADSLIRGISSGRSLYVEIQNKPQDINETLQAYLWPSAFNVPNNVSK